MSWNRHGSHWCRPLDCHDKLFRSIADAGKPLGREHWLLVGTVRVEFPPEADGIEGRLRTAWRALRFRHPDIAIGLHGDEKCYEPVADTEALEDWVASTFYVERIVSSANELFSSHLKVAVGSATCHWIPASSEVAIVSSHWRWDGRGLVMMLHEYLVGLTEVDPWLAPSSFGDETSNLVPSLDILMDVPNEKKEDWLLQADKLLAPFREGPPSIGLPIDNGGLPANTQRIETIVSRNTTTELRTACRARHIRLTAALHASIVVETARYQQSNTSTVTQYKSWAVFDLRKYCPTPFNGPSHAPSLRMVGLPLIIDAGANWDALAAYIQPFYQQSLASTDNDLMFVRVPFVEQATAMLATTQPTTEPNLSNLGIIDDYVQKKYGDVTAQNVWLAVQMLSPQLYVHTWSWRGRLHISICYNEAFYKADFVKMWLKKLKDNLLTNLNVEDTESDEID
ncbi:hypothetical protein F5Y05DRAFT_279534 [Hypoxylon sp. FL0543]|nr:hypothetical protein F5Y05DRAFT_279534 [Hypoxylon sp. FL0543]